MKLFKDLISGDEMSSDSYRHSYSYNDACIEFKAAWVTKKGDQILIAADEVAEDDPDVERVVDIVYANELIELKLGKKDVMAWAKNYLKKIEAKLKE